jgi:hypothetical protein
MGLPHRFGLDLKLMKVRILTFLALTFGVSSFLAVYVRAEDDPKPFAILHYQQTRPSPTGCDTKWKTTSRPPELVWMDDEHLAAANIYFCTHWPSGTRIRTHPLQITVFDASGDAKSRYMHGEYRLQRGPRGILLVNDSGQIDLVDVDLNTRQTLKCAIEKAACRLYDAPSEGMGSDFALCSATKTEEQCALYSGFPSMKVSEERWEKVAGEPFSISPYQRDGYSTSGLKGNLWVVGPSEVWYFDAKGNLLSRGSSGEVNTVSPGKWLPKEADFCSGGLSFDAPKRFLAVCAGAYVYSDGDLDSIFGFGRIALFDVASRTILAHFKMPHSAKAALSPSGKIIAIAVGHQIQLYRVNG